MAELEGRYGAYHDEKGRLRPEVWDGGAGGAGGWKAVARDRHLAWRRVTDVLGRGRVLGLFVWWLLGGCLPMRTDV